MRKSSAPGSEVARDEWLVQKNSFWENSSAQSYYKKINRTLKTSFLVKCMQLKGMGQKCVVESRLQGESRDHKAHGMSGLMVRPRAIGYLPKHNAPD